MEIVIRRGGREDQLRLLVLIIVDRRVVLDPAIMTMAQTKTTKATMMALKGTKANSIGAINSYPKQFQLEGLRSITIATSIVHGI